MFLKPFHLNYLLILITTLVIPSNIYAQKRICKIKYGEKMNTKRLEKKFFQQDLPESIQRKYGFECYQIGVEHDENKKPIAKSPIYACCQNYLPFLF